MRYLSAAAMLFFLTSEIVAAQGLLQQVPGPGPTPPTPSSIGAMTVTGSNATLPAARTNLGIEDATASYYTFGSGLFPSYATQTSTTANTTINIADITVASAANIALGDSIWATFVANGTYVTNIVGTTVSMSANATATGTGTAVSFGQNRFSAGKTALTDVTAAKVGLFGVGSQGRSTWLNQYFVGSDYLVDQSVLSISPYGTYAGLFASRASDSIGTAGGYTIPLAAQNVCDNPTTSLNCQALYLQSDLLSTAIQRISIGLEISPSSAWTPSAVADPYTLNPVGGVFDLRLDSGKGVASNTATGAVQIVNNGGKFSSGLIIQSDALDIAAGRIAPALAMGPSHSIDWYSAAGNAAWRLYSTATSGNKTIVLGNTAATFSAPIAISDTTASTSGTTGAFTSGGGVAAAGALWAGTFLGVSGTTLPTQAAGTLGLGGIATGPTLGANGEGDIYLTTANGLNLIGQGSTGDVRLLTSNGTEVARTQNSAGHVLVTGGVGVSSSDGPGTGIYLPATGTLGMVGASKLELFVGATNELDFAVTTAAIWTSTPGWTFSNAAIKMTGITTGTNADTVCLKSDGTLLIQAAACTISSMRFKNLVGDGQYKIGGALDTVAKLEPIVFTMKPGEKPNPDINYDKPQIGLSAENVAAIEPRCAIYEDDGKTPKSYRQECLIAVLVAGMQAQQREIEALKARRR